MSCDETRERGCPFGNAATATRSGRGRSRIALRAGDAGHAAWANGSRSACTRWMSCTSSAALPQVAEARVVVASAPAGGSPRSARKLVMPASRNSRMRRLASAYDRADAGQVRHRLDVGVLEHVAQHVERATARGAAGAEGHAR